MKSLVLGVLGRASRLYPVRLHAFVFLSNHYHLLLSVDDALQLAQFMNYLNSNIAREVERVHEWGEKFWGRRYQAIVISDEESAQVNRLHYLLSHGCKEGLVSRPRDWPGPHSVDALAKGQRIEGLWFDRTREYAARVQGRRHHRLAFATRETVGLDPLPCWSHLSKPAYRNAVAEVIQIIEEETTIRHLRDRTEPLGVEVILAQHPHTRPEALKRSRSPAFHAVSKAVREELVKAYSWFLETYRQAAETIRGGGRQAGFPEGCFPPGLPFVRWQGDLAPG